MDSRVLSEPLRREVRLDSQEAIEDCDHEPGGIHRNQARVLIRVVAVTTEKRRRRILRRHCLIDAALVSRNCELVGLRIGLEASRDGVLRAIRLPVCLHDIFIRL